MGRVTNSHSHRRPLSPPPSASCSANRWPSQYVFPGTWLGRIASAVVHGSVTPSLSHTRSTVSSAILRNVVSLPPTIVTKFSTPSREAWSRTVWAREIWRPSFRASAVTSAGGW